MFEHIIKSFMLAIGLVVDTFSISIINGISYKEKRRGKKAIQASIFAIIQGSFPLLGYIALVYFSSKLSFIKVVAPYISLILLSYLGIKLIIEAKNTEEIEERKDTLTLLKIAMQGVATSIDAVSCSFSMINLSLPYALIEVLIIALVTFIVSYIAQSLGKEIGNKIGKYSKVFGGIVLIAIGIILFVRR